MTNGGWLHENLIWIRSNYGNWYYMGFISRKWNCRYRGELSFDFRDINIQWKRLSSHSQNMDLMFHMTSTNRLDSNFYWSDCFTLISHESYRMDRRNKAPPTTSNTHTFSSNTSSTVEQSPQNYFRPEEHFAVPFFCRCTRKTKTRWCSCLQTACFHRRKYLVSAIIVVMKSMIGHLLFDSPSIRAHFKLWETEFPHHPYHPFKFQIKYHSHCDPIVSFPSWISIRWPQNSIVILILKQCYFCGIATRNYRQIQCSMLREMCVARWHWFLLAKKTKIGECDSQTIAISCWHSIQR